MHETSEYVLRDHERIINLTLNSLRVHYDKVQESLAVTDPTTLFRSLASYQCFFSRRHPLLLVVFEGRLEPAVIIAVTVVQIVTTTPTTRLIGTGSGLSEERSRTGLMQMQLVLSAGN